MELLRYAAILHVKHARPEGKRKGKGLIYSGYYGIR
jgi:hypothetical protein